MEENKLEKIPENTPEIKKPRRRPVGLVIGIVILLIIVSVLVYQYLIKKEQAERLAEQKTELMEQFFDLRDDFSVLETENDSMNELLVNKQEEIGNLIVELNRSKANNRAIIRKYKKEFSTLREILRSYIVQVDSLNTMNKALTAENFRIKTEMAKETNRREELEEQTSELSSKVKQAEVLMADNIVVAALNSRSRETKKVKKVNKIRTCLTVRANAVAEAGPKMVYVRLLRPDNVLLAFSEESYFEAEDERLIYSEKREVEYLNEDVDMCIYWDNQGNLIKGEYTIEIFCEGYQIGLGKLLLK